jgi:hypothetical protein
MRGLAPHAVASTAICRNHRPGDGRGAAKLIIGGFGRPSVIMQHSEIFLKTYRETKNYLIAAVSATAPFGCIN